MSKPVDEVLDERRPLPRLYAHYHRLLIDLLEDLVGAETSRPDLDLIGEITEERGLYDV